MKGPPLRFGQHFVSFIRHDEAINRRAVDVDRVVWLMLLCYPNDLRAMPLVAKSISGFSLLKNIHPSSNLSTVVVKALVNKEDDVPDEIVVTLGDAPKAPSWTVPVYILHATDVPVDADEDAITADGPLHPMPHPAPRWAGMAGEISHGADTLDGGLSVGNAPMEADLPEENPAPEGIGNQVDANNNTTHVFYPCGCDG